MTNIAIIPARSGSKGLPDKNIKLLNGKPLLAYSVEAALSSEIFDEVYVSTDSQRYADIAISCGAQVPFLRSEENASDTASSWDVVREALRRYEELGHHFDMVTLLQPTTPLRSAEDIKEAYRLFRERGAKSIVSVCETDHSPLWCNTLPVDQSMSEFIRKELVNQPRQQLDKYYRINGAVYMVDTHVVSTGGNIYEADSYAYIMKKEKSIDIDDELDFIIAEAIAKRDQREI
jgi:CMP-N,N'-diacetyllegionaminic acid synthase